jgi:hypothetical protein
MEHEERSAHHKDDVGEVPQHDEVGEDAIEHDKMGFYFGRTPGQLGFARRREGGR